MGMHRPVGVCVREDVLYVCVCMWERERAATLAVC